MNLGDMEMLNIITLRTSREVLFFSTPPVLCFENLRVEITM